MGVSFAIPIDYAMDVVDQLKEKGYVARGWLGVSIQEVTSELAEALDMEVPKGALISQIIEDSPAEKSGLKEERKSETATEIFISGPAGLPADMGQRRSLTMEAMNRALKAGYPRDYQAMIRRYFNAISAEDFSISPTDTSNAN